MEFIIHPEALQEMIDAAEYYYEIRPRLGKRFLSAVEAAFDKIFESPDTGFIVEDVARMCRVKRFPYGVVFVHRENITSIVAVTHFSRRPGYWLQRIED